MLSLNNDYRLIIRTLNMKQKEWYEAIHFKFIQER